MAADLFGETPAAPAAPVSLGDMVACLGREVRMRESLYPKWVAVGRLTPADASAELSRMRAALTLVSAIAAPSDALLEAVANAIELEVSRQARSGFVPGGAMRRGLEALVEAVR